MTVSLVVPSSWRQKAQYRGAFSGERFHLELLARDQFLFTGGGIWLFGGGNVFPFW